MLTTVGKSSFLTLLLDQGGRNLNSTVFKERLPSPWQFLRVLFFPTPTGGEQAVHLPFKQEPCLHDSCLGHLRLGLLKLNLHRTTPSKHRATSGGAECDCRLVMWVSCWGHNASVLCDIPHLPTGSRCWFCPTEPYTFWALVTLETASLFL